MLGSASPRVERVNVLPQADPPRFSTRAFSSCLSPMLRSEDDMVVDIRVSWPSSASLDFRLQTENIPKITLRLDRFPIVMLI